MNLTRRTYRFIRRYILKNPLYVFVYSFGLLMPRFVSSVHFYTEAEIVEQLKQGKSILRIGDGDIYTQIPISFTGYLSDILARIVIAGVEGTKRYIADLVSNNVTFTPQADLERYPPLKRRTPNDGEITLEGARTETYTRIYNLVRGLQAPYPNAYISIGSGTLYIETVEFSTVLPVGYTVLTTSDQSITEQAKSALAVNDGFALITKSRLLLSRESA